MNEIRKYNKHNPKRNPQKARLRNEDDGEDGEGEVFEVGNTNMNLVQHAEEAAETEDAELDFQPKPKNKSDENQDSL
ncbi:hypothetical protein FQA39_LY12595 [Lamprigera yunnana]|nr:hypothetical protein FQA39_LY12595 [Lamprigera yunnana]